MKTNGARGPSPGAPVDLLLDPAYRVRSRGRKKHLIPVDDDGPHWCNAHCRCGTTELVRTDGYRAWIHSRARSTQPTP